jgi:hypothetical protein
MDREQYLGDGVYATMEEDGVIVLDLRGQDDTTRIVLEPEVLVALVNFARAPRTPENEARLQEAPRLLDPCCPWDNDYFMHGSVLPITIPEADIKPGTRRPVQHGDTRAADYLRRHRPR